jgi:transcriptional regulator with XRE-family HTH domain
MPPRRGQRQSTTANTKLARRRVECGITQGEMADACGTSISTYARLETGRLEAGVPLWLLNNCALALGVTLEDLIEPEWRQWENRYGSQPDPPDPRTFWRRDPDA